MSDILAFYFYGHRNCTDRSLVVTNYRSLDFLNCHILNISHAAYICVVPVSLNES